MFKQIKSRAFVLLSTLVFILSSQATESINLTNDSENFDISPFLLVYPQQNRPLTFDEFKLSRTNLSYHSHKVPNYGFNPTGVWLFGDVKNQSDQKNWILNLSFSQLEQVDLYIVSNNTIIKKASGGRDQSRHFYRTPTFEVELNKEQAYQVYVFIRSKNIPIIAPMRFMTERQNRYETLFDYLIWGMFYGGLLVIAIYCVAVLIDKKEASAIVLFVFVCLIFLWQMVWSGHVQLLPAKWHSFILFRSLDLLLPLVCAAASLFMLSFLPKPKKSSTIYLALKLLFILLLITFIAVAFDWLSDFNQAMLIRAVGFVTLLCNILFTLSNIKQTFIPAKTVLSGWLVLTLGSIISSLFVAGKLPVNLFTTYIFQISLLAQTLCFVLAIILKVRFKLELEIHQASNDAENNFLLIEEQNIHLDMARREAIKASAVKSQFLANMSHEIRTPLNAIIGFSKELQRKINVTERDEHVRIINSSASDLLTIVNDILDFSKMEAGKLTINQKPFSPREALEEIASLMAKSAHLKQLEFMLDIAPLPSVLIGDSFKLKQLISNILSNALKFTNYGTITLRTKSIACGDDEVLLLIEVEDTGIGISHQDKKKLFKPFNQLDDELNRSFQGTGLGLVICQELTFLMNGNIDVESHYSHGSKFTVSLPFKLVNTKVTPTKLAEMALKTAGIYDPIPESRLNTARLLKRIGFNIFSYDSIAAFEKSEARFDYIFGSLPMRDIILRTQVINRILKINSDTTVLLFSGPPPEQHQIRRTLNQTLVLRSPLTLKDINDLNAVQIDSFQEACKFGLSSLPAARVLATDDMDLNLKLLDTWLKDSAVTLDTASSGEQAIALCKHNEYDLILMDIQMPNMDGLETTKHIRKTELNGGTPIIAITAHAFPEDKERFLSSGMDDYLPKPIDLESLVKTIQNWCIGIDFTEAKSVPINWQIAIKKAHGNEQSARDFLNGFIQLLPESMSEIESHWQKQDFESLQQCVHKLHGVSAYTGAISFQKICFETETNLKRQQYSPLKKLISTLLVEAEAILEQWDKFPQVDDSKIL